MAFGQHSAGIAGLQLAGLGAGAVMCWPQFFVFTMAAGFQTTIVLTFLLAVSAHEVLMAKANELHVVTICSAAVVLTVHTIPLDFPSPESCGWGAMTGYRQVEDWRVDKPHRVAILVIACSALAAAPVLQ